MRWSWFVALVALACGGAIGVVASVEAQKLPPPITFEQGKDSPGPVTFDHAIHKEANEKCTVCHTKIFKMKKGTSGNLTMAKMQAGESCGVCHNGKTEVKGKKVPASDDAAQCASCHRK
jgi:c(7)-type cytochrome triheme protein